MSFIDDDLACSIDPSTFLEELDVPPYMWQREALDPRHKRILVLAARQSGKSSIASGRGHHTGKFYPGALSLIVSPSEQQSKETMKKVEELISKDPTADLTSNASFEKTYANGSRILALPGTERSVRGYSAPRLIIMDEAARIEDATYNATRPMLTGNPSAVMCAVTTPFGKSGWFYRAWTSDKYDGHDGGNPWKKILVKPAFRLDSLRTTVVPDIKEEWFRDKWKHQGVSAYYSPRHTQEFLQEELNELGWWWWQQEYGCEFLEEGFSPFDMNAVRDSFDEDDGELFSVNDIVDEGDDEILFFS